MALLAILRREDERRDERSVQSDGALEPEERRLVEAAGEEVRDAVLADRALRRRLIGVLGVSATLGDLLVANPGEWRELVGEQTQRPAGYATRDVSTVPLLRSARL